MLDIINTNQKQSNSMNQQQSSYPRLSVVMCIHNEEARLESCLQNLIFADEIVIVLDRSTDRSKQIAQKFGAKIIEGAYELEGTRRNLAIKEATGDWCLEVDADEIVPSDLAQEIRSTIVSTSSDYHLISIDNYIGKRLVRYGWGASFGKPVCAALFKKEAKHWGPQRVHPQLAFQGTKGSQLKHAIQHYVDRDLTDMLERLNKYSSARAKDLKNDLNFINRTSETFYKNFVRFFFRFYKCFFRRKGYKEGSMGFMIALCAGLFPLLSYLKAVHEK